MGKLRNWIENVKTLVNFNGKFFVCKINNNVVAGRIAVRKGFIYLCNDYAGSTNFKGVPKFGYSYQIFCCDGSVESQALAGVKDLAVSIDGSLIAMYELC